jgi:3',5'-cyclic AMP phosphodiesterase CpdA
VRLLAIGDLHVSHEENRPVVEGLRGEPGDWLALAGDVGVTAEHLRWTLGVVRPRFERVLWVPGNHDLWTHPRDPDGWRGEERYRRLVEICRSFEVDTPEDDYPACVLDGEEVAVAPLFLLYDYSFRRPGLSKDEAIAAARRVGTSGADERLLHPDPYPSREDWCHARVEWTARRLEAVPADRRTVLVSHFPLRRDVVRLRAIPLFAPWCGTTLTDDWHLRFRAGAVVSGHLHVPGTMWRDGVPFREVSLGYPRQWRRWRWRTPGPTEVRLGGGPGQAGGAHAPDGGGDTASASAGGTASASAGGSASASAGEQRQQGL